MSLFNVLTPVDAELAAKKKTYHIPTPLLHTPEKGTLGQ